MLAMPYIQRIINNIPLIEVGPMTNDIKKYCSEFYKVLTLVLVVSFLALNLVSIGKYSSLSKGITKAFHEYFLKNVPISASIYIVILSPWICLFIYKLISLLYPTIKNRSPHQARIRVRITHMLGITAGLAALLIILVANGYKTRIDTLMVAISLLWLLTVSIAMFTFRDPQKDSV